MGNLAQGLQDEIARATDLLVEYEKIPTGVFGAMMIRQALAKARKVLAEGDTIGIMRAYSELKGLE